MRPIIFRLKRTINKKVTIHGSSGSPEKGNLIKHKQDDATASYKNVKNYALHTTARLSAFSGISSTLCTRCRWGLVHF